MKLFKGLALGAAVLALTATAQAQTRVTYKSAKTGTSYYQMAVQAAEAIKAASNGEIIVTVEESQGSVQNVMEASVRPGNYMFTTPPALVPLAQEGKAMFEGRANPRFDEIRALFPIPSLTMHFVTRADANVAGFEDLKGKKILIGKGSFGAREGAKYLDLFGVKDDVELANVELSNAVSALKNGQIDGFVTSGSYPAPNVIEAAASVDVDIMSLSDNEIAQTKRTRIVIPAGTYTGQDADVATTSLPVVAYTTTQMDDDTAYAVTKSFWEEKAKLAKEAPWWAAVDPAMLELNTTKLHPGALRYYDEAGVAVPDSLR